MASPPQTIRPGDVVGARFELVALRGEGGMGRVYAAREVATGRKVAVKTLLGAGAGSVERFEREAAVLAKLSHPNVVAYLASGRTDDGAPWLAMEWLDGEDLAARLERGPLSIDEARSLARAVASALSAAHAQSLVHRDIKPANVFLPAGDVARAKVLDFGVARLLDASRATATGAMIGTVGYMAPEQARGHREVGPAADFYSLGCVLYECVAGHPVFPGEHAVAVLAKVLLETPPPLAELELATAVPPSLSRVVSRMLEKDPALRPATAEAVLAALQATDDTVAAPLAAPRRASAVGGAEHALVSLVFVSARATALGATLLASDEEGRRARIASVLAEHGGQPDVIVDGTQFATVVVNGTARDHARQAARCALAVRAIAGDVGIALATGRMPEGRAFGDVIDRGAALVHDAPEGRPDPSAIDVDETTAALVRDDFRVVERDGRWFLLGEMRRSVAPMRLACVGREREIASVVALADECVSEEVARAALLVGPPGIGKSLLVGEVLDRVARDRQVWRAEADPVGAGAPHRLVAQLALSAAGLRGGEAPAEKLAGLRALAKRHVPGARAEAVASALAAACGLAADAPGDAPGSGGDEKPFAEALRAAWDDLVAGALRKGPLTLVLEDIHWADRPSIRLVDHSLRRYQTQGSGSAPLFVLATARPDVHTVFPGLWAERAVQETRLTELGKRAATRLVAARLGPDADPEAVSAIVERAAGNAFFLVELTRVVAAGQGLAAVPDTVIGVVEARLRTFDRDDRRALRAASVFGQHFVATAVASLLAAERVEAVTARLEALVERDVLRREGDGQYVFSHALVRDAAYAMLGDDDRRAAHLAAAAWLEGEGAFDFASLAHHIERGADVARAIQCYAAAAADALDAGDYAATLEYVERAVALGAEGAVRGSLLAVQAEAVVYTADKDAAVELAKEAMKLLPAGSDAWLRASRVVMGVGFIRSAKLIS